MKKERVSVKFGKEIAKNVDFLNEKDEVIASVHVFKDGSIFVNKGVDVFINDKIIKSTKLEWDSLRYTDGCNWQKTILKVREIIS